MESILSETLPPLTALRAFEAAARLGSFVQAGVELGVTAAAVSLQVRGLEEHFGKRLFLRQGNRIILTDAGRGIYPRLEQAMSELRGLAADLRADQGRARLVISVLPSLAELWLAPALQGLEVEALEIRVEDQDPVRLSADGVAARLTYGAHFYPDHRVERLFADQIVAVAAPGGAPAELIHTDWGPSYASAPSWGAWVARNGGVAGKGLRVGTTALALAAARAGLGAALAPSRLARADLEAGRLVLLPGAALPMPWDYVLVTTEAAIRRKSVQRLLAHLRAAA